MNMENTLIITPRKKPVILMTLVTVIILAFFAWLLPYAATAAMKISFWTMIILLLASACGAIAGLLRTKLVFSEDGIRSVTSAFSKEMQFSWKEIRQVTRTGNWYAIRTKDDRWVGSFDYRNLKTEEALEYLRKKHIAVTKED